MKKVVSYIFAIFVVMLTFTACVGNKSNNVEVKKTPNEVQEELKPKVGGELVLSTRAPKTFNPIENKNKDVDQILKLIYSPLVDLDDEMKPIPSIAESWEMNSIGTSITLNLRQDIKFHDGKILNSDDVIYTLNAIKNASEDSIYKENVKNILSYKALDEYKVKINYSNTSSDLLYNLYIPVISKNNFTNNANNEEKIYPIGTGRYKFVDYNEMKEFNLVRNDEYKGENGYIEKIKVLITSDEDVDIDAFKQKQIDVVYTDKLNLEKYVDDKSVKSYPYSVFYYDFLGFNFKNEKLKDNKIRQAIAHSIDKAKLLEKYYLGYADEADTPINPQIWLAKKDIQKYEYDKEKANKLVKEANAGKSGKTKLKLLVNKENYERVNVANELKKELDRIGFVIEIDEQPLSEYMKKVNSKDFDLLLGGWKLLNYPNLSFIYNSSEVEDGKNYGAYTDMNMDILLKKSFIAVGEEQQKKAFDELQKYISEELPYISLYFRKNMVYTNAKVKGDLDPKEWFKYNGIENCYIEVQ